MIMSEQEPDTGIAATCPNAAVEFCRGAVSPCDDSCAYCYAALDGSAGVTCVQCSKRKLCSDKCRDRDWEVLCSIALPFKRPPSCRACVTRMGAFLPRPATGRIYLTIE
jgi:hypothetical protein